MRSIYDKLTILITAHDGHQYLKRLLAHHANTRFKILVADSSPNRITSDLLNENTRYIYTPGMGIGEKLLQAYKQVQTEFVVWNSDDDFLVEEGLVEAIRFLQNNPDYSSVHGKIFFKDKGYTVSYRERLSIEGNSIKTRLNALADKQYNNNLFSVNRTKDMCRIFEKLMYRYVTPCYEFEIDYAIANLAHGKRKAIDDLYLVRENVKGSAGEIHQNTLLKFGEDNDKRDKFTQPLSKYITNVSSITLDEAVNSINSMLINYAREKNNNKSVRSGIFFKKFFPFFFIKFVKYILGLYSLKKIKEMHVIKEDEFYLLTRIVGLIDKNIK